MRNKLIFALNLGKTEETILFSLGINVSPAKGMYKGEAEPSWIVSSKELTNHMLVKLLKQTKQESVLFVNNTSKGFLLFAEDNYTFGQHTLELGEWTHLGDTEPETSCYTCINGHYYACL